MIKDRLKNTALYRNIKRRREMHRFRKFSEQDQRRLRFYRQFIDPGDIVFDVGANLGNRSKIFLKLGARVIAFEPQRFCIDFLKSVLTKEKNFTLVESALGSNEADTVMLISESHTLSTLSSEWVESTQGSGRFDRSTWTDKQPIHVTTLDHMIEQFGLPTFIKIDVEGYEYEVLSGLSSPVKGLSIEFAAENINIAFQCIDHMCTLADMTFQYSEGESMLFKLPQWVSASEIKKFLQDEIMRDPLAFGDIYMKIKIQ